MVDWLNTSKPAGVYIYFNHGSAGSDCNKAKKEDTVLKAI